jgi:hypothetical protein
MPGVPGAQGFSSLIKGLSQLLLVPVRAQSSISTILLFFLWSSFVALLKCSLFLAHPKSEARIVPTMKISTGIFALVAAVCITTAVYHGIPHEDDEIVAKEHRSLSEAHANLRARILQETGTDDSQLQPILADYFGGEPGFYHGVGK